MNDEDTQCSQNYAVPSQSTFMMKPLSSHIEENDEETKKSYNQTDADKNYSLTKINGQNIEKLMKEIEKKIKQNNEETLEYFLKEQENLESKFNILDNKLKRFINSDF